ncbi:MAG: hypothetical protein IKS42_07015 [Oscillospiraceae bacterium]|nr:hypothetical protein [Oscillospiraceae bacterium]
MKEMKFITVRVLNTHAKTVSSSDVFVNEYPMIDKVLTAYAKQGYTVKAMSQVSTDGDIRFVLERDI